MHRVAVTIGEHLYLDVARPLQILLDNQPVVAERRRSLAPCRFDRRRQLGLAAHDPHALAAAAGRRLEQYREADRRSEEHTSELQSLMRISYAVFCLKKKKEKTTNQPESRPSTATKHTTTK